MMLYPSKAQSITEYAILLTLVASVFAGMQVYTRRGLQGRFKETSDFLVDEINKHVPDAYNRQYEPYYSSSVKGSVQESLIERTLALGGAQRQEYINDTQRVNLEEEVR